MQRYPLADVLLAQPHKAGSMKDVFYTFLARRVTMISDVHRKSDRMTESRRGEYEWLQIDGSEFDSWVVTRFSQPS